MKIGAVYIRVSTTDQLEYSPESQLRLITDYAKRNKITIFDEYIYKDEGISGRTAEKRPAFQRMIAAAKQKPKPFDCILVYSTSRFARNHEQSIVYRSMLEKQCGVELISITQPNVDKKTDMLTTAIYSIMDEWYSLDLSENVKRGMTQKAMEGGYQTSAPFGYEKKYRKAPLSIVEPEAEIVRYIFNEYVNGTSKWYIARNLDDKGIKAKRGGKFSTRNITYILQNPVYVGYARWTPNGKRRSWDFQDENTLVVKSNHEPIVSEDLFNKAQQLLKENAIRNPNRQQRPKESTGHWLSGIMKCSACGSTLMHCRAMATKKYPSFKCGGYGKGTCKTANFITQHEAEDLTLTYFETITQDIALTYDINISKATSNQADTDLIKAQQKKIAARLKRAKQGFLDGAFDLIEYKEIKEEAEAELEKLKSQISSCAAQPIDYALFQKNIKNVYDILKNPAFNKNEKQTAIRSIVEKIVVNKKTGDFEIYFLQF